MGVASAEERAEKADDGAAVAGLAAVPESDPAEERLFTRRTVVVCVVLFVGSFLIYAVSAHKRFWSQSKNIHFVDLAHSYWAGQLNTLWSNTWDRKFKHRRDNDWARLDVVQLPDRGVTRGICVDAKLYGYNFWTTDGWGLHVDARYCSARCYGNNRHFCKLEKHYVSFPPGPALLMMPLVKIWGWRVNDVMFTIFFAALNVVLIFLLMRLLVLRGHCARTLREQIALALLFGFGTIAWFSSIRGEVWFTALVVGVTFNTLFIMAALDTRRPLLAGICLAAGFATRTPIAFASLFFFLQLFFPEGRWRRTDWKPALVKLAWFCVPCLTVGIALLVANYVRFQSLTEFGHTYLPSWAGDRIRLHGMFSPRHINRNLVAALTQVPLIVPFKPYVKISQHGVALWFTTPVLLMLLWPQVKGFLHRYAWLTVAAVALPLLFYQNTGWLQFGYRFSLDVMPYLMLLLAIGGRRFSKVFYALAVIAVLVNLFGAVTFDRMPQYYYDSSPTRIDLSL